MRFLTLIFGTVGSGKTAELLKIIQQIQEHNQHGPREEMTTFTVFKPTFDTRSTSQVIASRNGQSFDQAVAVSDLEDLNIQITIYRPEIIIIDECQFFETPGNHPQSFVYFIKKLLLSGRQVVLSGLIQDCHGSKFEILSALCPEADVIINPHVLCACGQVASRSQRLQQGYPTPITDPIFIVDNAKNHDLGYSYEPRCNNCWRVPLETHPALINFRKGLK